MQRMLDRLRRRGPDHEGHYRQGPVLLGHRRLAIIDLSAAADQPMTDEATGSTIVFNGTIYNYPALRNELIGRGHRFRSSGDTEVILKAYAEWGERCVERLIGMFAFAIWDVREQRLFLARDRLGIKPLYYGETRDGFRFASNVQALLAGGGVDSAIDPIALHHHMSLHAVVPAPRTLLKGVRKLPPAHTLSIGPDGRQQLRAYWHLSAQRPAAPRSEQDWVEAIHAALRTAVERRMRIADVPVGVLLSGGLDSSLLVALLAESGASGLKTFTVGFEDQPEEKGSEFEYSDPVAARYATEHHKFEIPNSEVLTRLPEAVDQMSEPMVAQDAVAFYLLSGQVSRHVKAVQSGQGADEVFGGYFWYPQMAAAQGEPIERFRPRYFDRDHAEYLRTVMPAYATDDVTSAFVAARLAEADADEFIDQVLRFDVTTLIVDDPVKRVDNMTMAWGLEARVPFLDHELVELAASMPPDLKLRDGGKYVLKQIARGRIPDAVIDRPKGYFPVPALKYVRGEAYDFMADIVNSRTSRERGLFRPEYVDALLADPEGEGSFTAIRGNKLWHLALLELWLQRHLDGAVY
ncbi:asparagine synthetase B [Acidihalobacter prosperus]|uniref:asparagine synthase (glutamine-hydrolyzing) n=2 Tax=Acidihalobacter prosperus TaxID=160660 RepID=A0A1A6C229_9GAMM|nr:asparagine synthetase B [Acidihalobacter prosperus]